jgi:hypothetical protein
MTLIVLTEMTGFSQSFKKGAHAFNLDIGFWNTAYIGNGHYSGFSPSFSGSYEYGVKEIPMGSRLTGVISVGVIAGGSHTTYSSSLSNHIYQRNDFIIGFRNNYHFIFHDKLDTYAGWWVGFDKRDYKWKGSGPAPEEVDFSQGNPYGGAFFGARWFFTDHIAIYTEVGWLISVVNIGVTFAL